MDNEALSKELDDILEGYVPPTTSTPEGGEVEKEEGVEKQEPEAVKEEDGKGEEKGGEGEERKPEEASGQEQEQSESVGKEGEQEEVTPVEPEKSELEELRKANEELRQQMLLMADKFVSPTKKVEKTPEQLEAEKLEAEKASKQVLGFIQNEDVFDEVFKSHHNFNALLTAVVNTSVEKVLKMAPQMVTTLVDQQVTMKSAAQEFYRKNDDLLEHKSFVGFVANEVSAQHPDWTLDKILEDTEREVRNRLRLHKQPTPGAAKTMTEKGTIREVRSPGFVPGAGAGRRGEVQTSLKGIDKDIMDLIS